MPVMTEPTTLQPRAAVLAMPEYHPPLADRSLLRLDFNENTFAPSPRVFAKLQSLTAEGLTIYPERVGVEQIVAAHYNLAPGEVMLTNGVDEAIHLLACTFLDQGDEVLLCTPSFFMYDVSCSMMTSNLIRIQADDTFQFPLDRILAAITPRTRLIMIATPNNPTGQTVSREQMLQLCEAAPHAVVFADEAYFHFHGESSLTDVPNVPNLIVGRTFSKAYGLANLRLGMLAGPVTLMNFIRKVASPYNVNGIALAVLPEALADETYLAWYVQQVTEGRERLFAALKDLGVKTWPSAANFILMDIGPRHAALVAAMRAHGVLLRDRSADPGCDGYVRITVGVEDHVTRGIAALRASLGELHWTPAESRSANGQSEGTREYE
jgi:histidinol-phosphate aminotransferase